ncbi:uncharacterized protein BDZ99DRAFT_524458 [Mytilinidion resinicola]|uniref:Uncharacterized protein n=1 Tax=Mytilinidion resinicola TaxID=574789 RepID=A0A6A6YCB8_9PEZI|nr:uncharacterized protein BDZ99DRAFT_524458 [Mytilinidion resinicola]KAF2805487.1 hypothetical protein BDZ99DRAFT_524458 [Mytilinidion resinicola]
MPPQLRPPSACVPGAPGRRPARCTGLRAFADSHFAQRAAAGSGCHRDSPPGGGRPLCPCARSPSHCGGAPCGWRASCRFSRNTGVASCLHDVWFCSWRVDPVAGMVGAFCSKQLGRPFTSSYLTSAETYDSNLIAQRRRRDSPPPPADTAHLQPTSHMEDAAVASAPSSIQ